MSNLVLENGCICLPGYSSKHWAEMLIAAHQKMNHTECLFNVVLINFMLKCILSHDPREVIPNSHVLYTSLLEKQKQGDLDGILEIGIKCLFMAGFSFNNDDGFEISNYTSCGRTAFLLISFFSEGDVKNFYTECSLGFVEMVKILRSIEAVFLKKDVSFSIRVLKPPLVLIKKNSEGKTEMEIFYPFVE